MKYLEQINLFNDYTEVFDLSANSQLLWFKLMHLNNRAFWSLEMKVSNQTLMGYLKITSLPTLSRARKELVEKGLIEYDSGTYRINQLIKDEQGIHPVKRTADRTDTVQVEAEEAEKQIEINISQNTSKPTKKRADPIPYDEIKDFWNEHNGNKSRITTVSKKRKDLLKKLIKAGYTVDDIKDNILKAEVSDFLNGKVTDWTADFEWVMREDHFLKILEGTYDNRKASSDNPFFIDINEDIYAEYR